MDAELKMCVLKTRMIVFDFDGVFTDNSVYVFQDGTEAVRCSRSDGLGLKKLDKLGISKMILSTETNSVVAVRSKKLGIDCIHGSENKLAELTNVVEKRGLSFEQVCFVGNDINDLECLKQVGFPVVVRDAYDDVIKIARYQTRANGGMGAVREICDLFEQAWKSENLEKKTNE